MGYQTHKIDQIEPQVQIITSPVVGPVLTSTDYGQRQCCVNNLKLPQGNGKTNLSYSVISVWINAATLQLVHSDSSA